MDEAGDGGPHPFGLAQPQSTRLLPVPPPPTIQPAGVRGGGNSSSTIAGVLATVLALVLAVALLGRFDGVTRIAGYPVAAPGQPQPNAPRAPASSATTTPQSRNTDELAANPLLAGGIGLPATTCQLPGMTRDPERLRAYYQAAIGCLDQAWKPVLDRIGDPFSSPHLEIQAGSSQCGAAPSPDEATAYYCSGGRVIFMPTDRLLDQAGLSQAAHLAVLAHEYGHHVQALSGILEAAYEQGAKAGNNSPVKQELTRRVELQANCFAGLFIASVAGHGSVTTKLARAAADSFRDTVGDDTHGTVKHQIAWARAGFDHNQTAACNTWTAASGEVS